MAQTQGIFLGPTRWPGNDPADYQNLSDEGRRILGLWIQTRLEPVASKQRRHMLNSYGLKHVMERENGLYVTNGQFKGAMQLAGYEAYGTDDINWWYRVRVKPKGTAA